MNNMIVWQKMEKNIILNIQIGTNSNVRVTQIFLSVYLQSTSGFFKSLFDMMFKKQRTAMVSITL
jgi:hypothetical protein